VDRAKLWSVQTPQIFRTQLLRDAYKAALATGATFTDDTAVVESMGHPVRIVLYHGINLKVTTPADWALAEAFVRAGEGEGSPGMLLRKQLHDMNNHLTPLLGYVYLLVNELPEDSRPKKFAKSVQMAAERCQATTALIQKYVRELFPKKGE
jgi:2-C-methyl-D-erythritol 4-phosphate cytidylyltransferase